MGKKSNLEVLLKSNDNIDFPELIGIIERVFKPNDNYTLFDRESTQNGTYSYTYENYRIEYTVKKRGMQFMGNIEVKNTSGRRKTLLSAGVGGVTGSPFYSIKVNAKDPVYSNLVDAIREVPIHV